MSWVEVEEFARFKESVKKCSRICQIKQFPVKAVNGWHPVKGVKTYCHAVFACEDKKMKRVRQKKTKDTRIYQVCLFDGCCNQQSFEPIYWEV
jgi:hypothetical protein